MVSHCRGAETSISARHEGYLRAFVMLDAIATALGQWLLSYRYEANLAGGLVVAVFGSSARCALLGDDSKSSFNPRR